MCRRIDEELVLSVAALLLAGIAPNIFPAAQAGLATMPVLAVRLLIPSLVLLAVVSLVARLRDQRRLTNRLAAGLAAGLIATLGLEAVRTVGFHLGWMPGDLPRLLGVLLTDRFMLGPSPLSDALGYAYHFWNGASFGLIFAVIFGRRRLGWAVAYAELVGIGFLASPAVKAMGVGFMAARMPAMIVTVLVAHSVFGFVLGVLLHRWVRDEGWLLARGPESTWDQRRPAALGGVDAGGRASTAAARPRWWSTSVACVTCRPSGRPPSRRGNPPASPGTPATS